MSMTGLIQVFVAFLFFLVFKCTFLHKKSHGQPILKNWPFLGMLPGMLACLPRIFDFSVEVLEAANLNFSFKGPWLSGTNMLFTADTRNINHILSLNFGNYPKGREAKKIFNALGDGILSADMELWEDLRIP
ncbi:Alkane hydroxylase MAH1 [Raphanus sativus]|nr:Alkane hydroxylase MAH1 [Raphanus sativus]